MNYQTETEIYFTIYIIYIYVYIKTHTHTHNHIQWWPKVLEQHILCSEINIFV